jgi:hypothetical protein
MNCKPGDMAVIVEATNPHNRNRIVEVLEFPGRQGQAGWMWMVECVTPLYVIKVTGSGREPAGSLHRCYVPDAWMRPIRDPGEQARDEMLRPLPEEVAA